MPTNDNKQDRDTAATRQLEDQTCLLSKEYERKKEKNFKKCPWGKFSVNRRLRVWTVAGCPCAARCWTAWPGDRGDGSSWTAAGRGRDSAPRCCSTTSGSLPLLLLLRSPPPLGRQRRLRRSRSRECWACASATIWRPPPPVFRETTK